MQFETTEECRQYVERELARTFQSQTGWHIGFAHGPNDLLGYTAPEMPRMRWKIYHVEEDSWYNLDARMDEREFVVWFGNHQVGAEGLHWIMHPAVHIAYDDLWPRSDLVAIRYGLGDVLQWMIASLGMPRQLQTRFDLNTFALT